jgi:benzylsuccinate CoA-transferase BbsF subunit
VAVLAALLYRARTGHGQFIDLAQQETTIATIPEGVIDHTMNGIQPPRQGNRDPHMAPHGIFRCAGEQRWVAIAARTDADWQRLARAIGHPELAADANYGTLTARKANEDRLEELITAWTLGRSPEDATRTLQAAGVPAFTVYNSKDLSEDAHLNAAGFFVNLKHPEVGARQHVGIPWHMSGTPCAVRRPAPCLGEDTDYVLCDLLGYASGEVTRLKNDGVVS